MILFPKTSHMKVLLSDLHMSSLTRCLIHRLGIQNINVPRICTIIFCLKFSAQRVPNAKIIDNAIH